MQRITFLTVGKPKTQWITEGVQHFAERLSPHMRFELALIQPSKQVDPAKYREEESEKILARMEKIDGDVWVLDEKGEQMTSIEFSGELSRAKDAGKTLVFVLGGAYGVTEQVKKKAHAVIALSKMTFPHEFCQLVFLEQLYRASEIMRGTGYHH